MNEFLDFLRSQRLLVVASSDDAVWVSNVYYNIADDFTIYFISNEKTKHSKQIMKNSRIAFSVSWYNQNNHQDRKAIQGTGMCSIATSRDDIETGVSLHNTFFPEFAERITVDYILSNENTSRVWKIKPSYLKFWNDELFGLDGTEEMHFD